MKRPPCTPLAMFGDKLGRGEATNVLLHLQILIPTSLISTGCSFHFSPLLFLLCIESMYGPVQETRGVGSEAVLCRSRSAKRVRPVKGKKGNGRLEREAETSLYIGNASPTLPQTTLCGLFIYARVGSDPAQQSLLTRVHRVSEACRPSCASVPFLYRLHCVWCVCRYR
jgi:hypothetical protein